MDFEDEGPVEYDRVTQASLNGMYVKAMELDRGQHAHAAKVSPPPGIAAGFDAAAHASDGAPCDAQTHASDGAACDARTHACDGAACDARTHASDGSESSGGSSHAHTL